MKSEDAVHSGSGLREIARSKETAMGSKLLQSQKLASIGQLAAGVAHEINNPTGFVSSNLSTLDNYQNDLIRLIKSYQGLKQVIKDHPHQFGSNALSLRLVEIETLETDMDIDFVTEDIGALIAESREGTQRIKNIVNDLKRFAHPGEDKVQDTDINAGLVSTLNITNNELKYKADIITDFGDLPIISANPQQLNQVFVNILVNAAQAIEERGKIRIQTRSLGDRVEIRFSDTGCGISEEDLDKIFDPFFTTKEVGKGTGMGMNIVYNIIQNHNGTIIVESDVGVGTTFIIQLPLGQNREKDREPTATSEQMKE